MFFKHLFHLSAFDRAISLEDIVSPATTAEMITQQSLDSVTLPNEVRKNQQEQSRANSASIAMKRGRGIEVMYMEYNPSAEIGNRPSRGV